jgi:hypothetical protein
MQYVIYKRKQKPNVKLNSYVDMVYQINYIAIKVHHIEMSFLIISANYLTYIKHKQQHIIHNVMENQKDSCDH